MESTISLQWLTASEINNKGIGLYKEDGSGNFNWLTHVNGAGNSNGLNH